MVKTFLNWSMMPTKPKLKRRTKRSLRRKSQLRWPKRMKTTKSLVTVIHLSMRMIQTKTLGKAVFLWPKNSWIEAQARSLMTSLMTMNQTPRRGKPRKKAFKRSRTLSSGPRKILTAQKPKLRPRNRRKLKIRRNKRSKPKLKKKSSTTSLPLKRKN